MRDFFSVNGPLFTGLEKLVTLIWLSILWLVFSIPLVTAGASTTALYYAATKVLRHNRGYIWREFITSFKTNFKQSTMLWLLYAVVMGALYLYIVMIRRSAMSLANIFTIVLILLMIIISLIYLYIPPYIARFHQSIGGTLTYCAFMAFRHLPWTILLAGIHAAVIAGCILTIAGTLIIPAIGSLLSGLILERIFKRYMTDEDLKAEQLRNRPEMMEYFSSDQGPDTSK